MKKLLSLLVMLTMSISIYAQDVIVKKDGTTIMAKVLTVSTTVVEYKKWSNQDGPTYAIETKELLSINYANGEKEVFSEQKEAETATPVFTPTSTKYTQADIDQAVSRTTSQIVYKSTAGRGKIIAGGIILGVFGLPSLVGGIIGLIVEAPPAVSATSLVVGAGLTGLGWGIVSSG
ncbi:MAG: hypothetical protein K2H79_00735, partial [Bacteroidaceae bacterium]|nr:hypothetical protein [Bacteroidaceae bacterium]